MQVIWKWKVNWSRPKRENPFSSPGTNVNAKKSGFSLSSLVCQLKEVWDWFFFVTPLESAMLHSLLGSIQFQKATFQREHIFVTKIHNFYCEQTAVSLVNFVCHLY